MIGGLVYGHNAATVVLLAHVLPNGRVYVAHEIKKRQASIEDIAKAIKAQWDALNIRACKIACPLSMLPDDDDDAQVEAPTQTFARHGVPLSPVGVSANHPWARTHDFLRLAPDGKPWLLVSPRCKSLVRTMPSLIANPNDEDDLENGQDDRAALALQTLLASRPAPGTPQKEITPPAEYSLAWFKSLDANRSRGLLARSA